MYSLKPSIYGEKRYGERDEGEREGEGKRRGLKGSGGVGNKSE